MNFILNYLGKEV